MGDNRMLVVWLVGLMGLMRGVEGTFTLSFPNGTACSDVYTLTAGVTYTLNMSFPANDISAGSTVVVQFGYRFNVTASSLSGCLYSKTGVSYSNGTCVASPSGSSTSTIYSITFSGIYAVAATSQSFLYLKVEMG